MSEKIKKKFYDLFRKESLWAIDELNIGDLEEFLQKHKHELSVLALSMTLSSAAFCDKYEIAKLLLENGADVEMMINVEGKMWGIALDYGLDPTKDKFLNQKERGDLCVNVLEVCSLMKLKCLLRLGINVEKRWEINIDYVPIKFNCGVIEFFLRHGKVEHAEEVYKYMERNQIKIDLEDVQQVSEKMREYMKKNQIGVDFDIDLIELSMLYRMLVRFDSNQKSETSYLASYLAIVWLLKKGVKINDAHIPSLAYTGCHGVMYCHCAAVGGPESYEKRQVVINNKKTRAHRELITSLIRYGGKIPIEKDLNQIKNSRIINDITIFYLNRTRNLLRRYYTRWRHYVTIRKTEKTNRMKRFLMAPGGPAAIEAALRFKMHCMK